MPKQNSAPLSDNAGVEAVLKKQAEEISQLREQIKDLSRLATLGELTGTTTHEFNNLLMTILNYAKLGIRHSDTQTRDKSLNRIYDAANRAAKITGSVLALAKNRSATMEPTDLRPVVENTLLLIEREFRKFRVHLETDIEDVPAVLASPNELQRVIINLMVNARQATPEGGQVWLKLSHDDEWVNLQIRDTGSGIAQNELPKIFDRFYSTKSGPDASGKGGTGLGLSACKEAIDAHKGRIRVESTVGKGTAFTIRLPIIQDGS